MSDMPLPESLEFELHSLYPNIGGHGWTEFSEINDDVGILDKTRESKLRALAKKCGFIFKFIGRSKANG